MHPLLEEVSYLTYAAQKAHLGEVFLVLRANEQLTQCLHDRREPRSVEPTDALLCSARSSCTQRCGIHGQSAYVLRCHHKAQPCCISAPRQRDHELGGASYQFGFEREADDEVAQTAEGRVQDGVDSCT
jgi:uncharacterized protein (DUF1015 family)